MSLKYAVFFSDGFPKLETSESPCRPYHPIWYYITTTASTPLIRELKKLNKVFPYLLSIFDLIVACNLANTIANLKVIETIKKVKTKELCSEICKKDQDFGMGCEYFNFKVKQRYFYVIYLGFL